VVIVFYNLLADLAYKKDMKTCTNCKHYECVFTNLMDWAKKGTWEKDKKKFILLKANVSISGDYYGKCNNKNNRRMANFHRKYGSTKMKELEKLNIEMPCFEAPDHIKKLDSVIAKTDELLTQLKKGK